MLQSLVKVWHYPLQLNTKSGLVILYWKVCLENNVLIWFFFSSALQQMVMFISLCIFLWKNNGSNNKTHNNTRSLLTTGYTMLTVQTPVELRYTLRCEETYTLTNTWWVFNIYFIGDFLLTFVVFYLILYLRNAY